MELKFGSDGYRGIIGHSLTREALAQIARGVAGYLGRDEAGNKNATIPIGYDSRFMAREFAGFMARRLAELGYKPRLATRPCPSPYLAYATQHLGAPLGIQVTASHNPPYYCGVKLKGAYGGSLYPQDADLVERLANEADDAADDPAALIGEIPHQHKLDVDKNYVKAIRQAADWEGDRDCGVLVDFMHGVAAGIYREVLEPLVDLTTVLRAEPDPLFGGIKPEPAPARLKELSQLVAINGSSAVGLAFDGDGDRLAVLDEQGAYLAPHEIFCLLLEHLVAHFDRRGVVVTTVSFSGLIDRVADAHGCTVLNVPVGFKHVSRAMVENEAIIGGEESGGTGIGHYLPERDALLMALLLLAARQRAGTTLCEMVEQLYSTYGRPIFIRRDVPLESSQASDALAARIKDLASLSRLAGEAVTKTNLCDGMKLWTDAGWVLVRVSGTEPLLRVYAEGTSQDQAEAYAAAVLNQLQLEFKPRTEP